ncbi:MAG: hypothetical protein Q8J68_14000 [Methanolobus sp.]|uniref:AbrB/MazE/SpoVT family DNA-binding domain-containing protein n=1 Tax=Methanolobus sp. TaxID=1874737 RepID=UPI002730F852|nr:AbrB/MazE/SpoVT family DNA-binding domain-containing protein [Methanolobus sp.]MDP2218386.1 hypothetical protein [Methanolobus sp.]
MFMMTVNGKLWRNYQILIPPEVTESLGIRPGNSIRFIIFDDGRVELVKVNE